MSLTDIRRAWINQPSTNQPYHHLDGARVLVVEPDSDIESARILFADRQDTIAQMIPWSALAVGSWDQPRVRIAPAPGALCGEHYVSLRDKNVGRMQPDPYSTRWVFVPGLPLHEGLDANDMDALSRGIRDFTASRPQA